MKSFWASLCIFGTLIGVIIWNSIYIRRTCTALYEAAEALPACESAGLTVDALSDFWEQESSRIKLSVSRHTINKIDECLAEWKSAAKLEDETEYERCRHLFLTVMEQISRAETPSPRNWI